jgi:hypothetical protein
VVGLSKEKVSYSLGIKFRRSSRKTPSQSAGGPDGESDPNLSLNLPDNLETVILEMTRRPVGLCAKDSKGALPGVIVEGYSYSLYEKIVSSAHRAKDYNGTPPTDGNRPPASACLRDHGNCKSA